MSKTQIYEALETVNIFANYLSDIFHSTTQTQLLIHVLDAEIQGEEVKKVLDKLDAEVRKTAENTLKELNFVIEALKDRNLYSIYTSLRDLRKALMKLNEALTKAYKRVERWRG